MLAISQLIKIVLGLFVVIAVIGGLVFFASYVSDFFDNVTPSEDLDENIGSVNIAESDGKKVEEIDNDKKSEETGTLGDSEQENPGDAIGGLA